MKNLKNLLNNLIVEESGQDLIEYALVAALIGLGAVASVGKVSTALNAVFTNISTSITGSI